MKPPAANAPVADVCLMLEGTYPYVLGGVSSWVDQIIRGLPEIRFALFYIGSKPGPDAKQHYQLPPNVVSLQECYLHERLSRRQLRPAFTPPDLRAMIYRTLKDFYLANDHETRMAEFWTLLDGLNEADRKFRFGNLLKNREAWEILHDAYDRFAPDESFIDFFWTVRFLHLPLWNLWQARRLIPKARMYHTVSAGYAGFIAAIAARHHQVPCLLTEHGIYTKERIAEISQAEWIFESDRFQINYTEGLGKLKQLWINLFMFLGQVIYDAAGNIITLYDGNAHTQVEFGARPEKIRVIPNGIDPGRFDAIYRQHMERWSRPPEKKFIGFIGRVVPIKDVKTLLRAARIVCERVPGAEFLIAGPYSEDPIYFDECQKIVSMLHIEDRVHFLGMQKIMDVLPRMDVIVLTSISEGLPLVILEGMAAGKAIVATDVGACRELVFGRTPADKALGRAGRITKIMSPADTAHALIGILNHPGTVQRMGLAGRKRTEQFYTMSKMLEDYRALYGGRTPDPVVEPRPERPAVFNFKARRKPRTVAAAGTAA